MADRLECRNYTHARRHPLVLGKIAGWALPWPLTPAQVGVLVATFVGLLVTRQLWGIVVPGVARAVVLVGVPAGLAWAVRHARVQGRAPWRAAAGMVRLASQPSGGVAAGSRRLNTPRECRVRHRLLVDPGRRANTGPPAAGRQQEPACPWACLPGAG